MDKPVSSHGLKQTFDRRSFALGAIQGGIGLLLAARAEGVPPVSATLLK